jgi:hypothetical protein
VLGGIAASWVKDEAPDEWSVRWKDARSKDCQGCRLKNAFRYFDRTNISSLHE